MFNFFKKKPSDKSERLVGPDLVAKVKDLNNHLSKTEIAIACGYYRMSDGEPYPLFFEFYTAVLDSYETNQGINLGEFPRNSRKLSYRAIVQGNGNMVLGKAYTAMMDLHPGDEFEIKLGNNNIRLTRVGALDI